MRRSEGGVEILRFPDGTFAVVTKAWWQRFLKQTDQCVFKSRKLEMAKESA